LVVLVGVTQVCSQTQTVIFQSASKHQGDFILLDACQTELDTSTQPALTNLTGSGYVAHALASSSLFNAYDICPTGTLYRIDATGNALELMVNSKDDFFTSPMPTFRRSDGADAAGLFWSGSQNDGTLAVGHRVCWFHWFQL
jgi:hypothetical protein